MVDWPGRQHRSTNDCVVKKVGDLRDGFSPKREITRASLTRSAPPVLPREEFLNGISFSLSLSFSGNLSSECIQIDNVIFHTSDIRYDTYKKRHF